MMSRAEMMERYCEHEEDFHDEPACGCDCCAGQPGVCDACNGEGCADCFQTGLCPNCMPRREYDEAKRNYEADRAWEVAHAG